MPSHHRQETTIGIRFSRHMTIMHTAALKLAELYLRFQDIINPEFHGSALLFFICCLRAGARMAVVPIVQNSTEFRMAGFTLACQSCLLTICKVVLRTLTSSLSPSQVQTTVWTPCTAFSSTPLRPWLGGQNCWVLKHAMLRLIGAQNDCCVPWGNAPLGLQLAEQQHSRR